MKDMHASTLENKLLYGYTNYFYENLFGLSWKNPSSYTCRQVFTGYGDFITWKLLQGMKAFFIKISLPRNLQLIAHQ